MSGASCSSWDSDESFTDDETVIEYLTAALEESDPLIFMKAARNVARAWAMSSEELPASTPGLSPALEKEIRSTLGLEVSEDFPGWRVLEGIEAGAGPKTECERCDQSGTPWQQFEHIGVIICFACADERVAELGAGEPRSYTPDYEFSASPCFLWEHVSLLRLTSRLT